MRNPESITVNEDTRLIPVWSIVVAIAAFVLVEYYFWMILPASRIIIRPSVFTSTSAFRGRVGRSLLPDGGLRQPDAPRRAMSTRFWIAICFVMPGGIGAVLYFLLRQPEVSRCPACSTHVQSDFHFCPQCNYQLAASCGHCFRLCARPTSFARAAAMSSPRTTCRRGCA